ncbi:MAG: shikimate kinase [Kiritimatiellales bacterium]
MKKRNIILVGFMGTGKTATGKILAAKTGMPLVDMDSAIEKQQNRTISEIFATDGEAAFRQMERELVKELAARNGLIISTGGGIVLNSDNIVDFEKSGLTVCLTASAKTIFRRVSSNTTRPLLSGDKKVQIAELLEKRRPLYDAIRYQIDADRLNAEERADAILHLYTLEK